MDFYYEEGKPILSDFNLRVAPGETIALVGPTGGGKSTIVNLLCRFFEPRGGKITIHGVDYTDMTQHALQSRVGIVLQTPHLFSGTIRENIRYGRLDASDAEVEVGGQGGRGGRVHRQPGEGLRGAGGRGRRAAVHGPEAADQPGARRAGAARTSSSWTRPRAAWTR